MPIMTRTRALATGGAVALLAAAGLVAPVAASAASGVDVSTTAPVPGTPFTVHLTSLQPSHGYTLRLTTRGADDVNGTADENSCRVFVTGSAETSRDCTIKEGTPGDYDLKLLDGSTIVGNKYVSVGTVVAFTAENLPRLVDRPGVDHDALVISKVGDVQWKVGGTPVTFAPGTTSTDVPLSPHFPSQDYTIVADTAPGQTFPDGSTSWRKTYRFTTADPVPAALNTPRAPVKADPAGTADDTVTLDNSQDYTWAVDGVPVTFGPGETSKTLHVRPAPGRDGQVVFTATAKDGVAFAGGSPSYDFTYAYTDEAAEPVSTRIFGTDRIATGVEVSRRFFPTPGVDEVWVADALAFPDALSAGPAAARAAGPLLLTLPKVADPRVVAEVGRLRPKSIKVVGGADVVSEGVVAQLSKIAPVVRLQGADRYETSAAVASTWASSPVAYLASGRLFPDGLSAGSGAAHDGAPLLLTDGDGLSAATAASLKRLGASKVVLVGGSDVVRASVERQVHDVLPAAAVVRLSGADRYATSAAVVDAVTGAAGSTTAAFLAAGTDFPDALVGVPASARIKAPLLLTRRECLPGPAGATLGKLTKLTDVIRLGGADVVRDFPVRTPCA